MNNILLIDKPKEWTSFDVVAKIRGTLSKKEGKKIKVGHTGTLDPFATGLLIILVGKATKEQDNFMKLDKEYEATLKLGFESTTGDPEGEITAMGNLKPKISEVREVISRFIGEQEQTPHKFSAVKINGQKAYKLARAGQDVELKSRPIAIYSIEVLKYDFPELKVKVSCSSGTYIRVLAEDIGKGLGSSAYLTELKRTKIGDFDIKNAKSIEEVIQSADKTMLASE